MPTNEPSIPAYLSNYYKWAYIHPKAVWLFERQWLINLILWGFYKRLRNSVISHINGLGCVNILQIACAYGNLTPEILKQVGNKSTLDVIDILPIQLDNLRLKIANNPHMHLLKMDSSKLQYADSTFDQIVIFFLLHEQPVDIRAKTIQEAIRVLKDGGQIIVADYSKLPKWNPLRLMWMIFMKPIEPFAEDLIKNGLANVFLIGNSLIIEKREKFLGGAYEVLALKKGKA
jgi:ubiquinone/menaquinone biosynthesis C-methylase UbiE